MEEYCDRLISLCWAGHWEADAINQLLSILRRTTMKNLPVMLACLEKRDEAIHFPFWYFFFQSIVPADSVLILYEPIRAELDKYKGLSPMIFDTAFSVSFGRAPIGRDSYPSYKSIK